jgi:AcrR family transcriptional regulator
MVRGKRLPPGPKALSRDQVAQSQRKRLLSAMADAVAAKGYAKTTVADVLGRAEVSRATFYQLFENKDDCFRAAFDAFAGRLAQLMSSVLDGVRLAGDVDPIVKLDRVLTAYLAVLRNARSHARVFLVEVYAAGPEVVRERQASMERFADVVAETHRGSKGLLGTDPDQRFAVTAVVSAVSSMVTNAVATGDFESITELREPLLELARKINDAGRRDENGDR